MQSTENQRLKIFRNYLNKTQNDFGIVTGLKQGSYADVERGKVKVSGDIKNALNKEYSLNINWLETGEGEMIKHVEPERKMIQQPIEGYIPVYDVTFSLGFVPTFLDSKENTDVLGYVNFPELVGSSYVVRAKGNSMAPLINDGDFVGIRPVKNKNNIDYGNPYGIITEDLAVFKIIRKSGIITKVVLYSKNSEYDPFEITKAEIIHLFAVIGILSVKSITY